MNPLTGLDAREATVLADRVEAAASADMYVAAPAPLRARAQTVDGVTALLAPGAPITFFNRVVGLGLAGAASTDTVEKLVALYREAGVARWWLHWSPAAEPAAFEVSLQALGFVIPERRTWAKMLRRCEPLPDAPTTLQVVPTSAADRDATCAAIAAAFGMPPIMAQWLVALHARERWQSFSVRDGENIVGGGYLFVDGPHAWLGMGSVLPSHRGRGGQLALMAHRIAAAANAGCRWVVTETGEAIAGEANPSLANMRRAGFAQVASRVNLEWASA